ARDRTAVRQAAGEDRRRLSLRRPRLRRARQRSALRAGALRAAARPRLDSRLESVSVFAQENGRFVFPRLRPGTYRLRARLLGWQEVEVPVTLAGRKV